ncbi:DUF6711 family protein [Proteiniborus sp.]|uniref:DUF6711 family protein n=1 Tax=Proteiniborus sp. TaxID=2079015 RepID=UPI00331FBDED
MLKIDGVEMPAPVKYDVGIMDLSKAERNALGDMVIDRIATKRKIELDLTGLSNEEISKVLKAVSPVFFEVEYFDPQENRLQTGTFYSGDRNAKGLRYEQGKLLWKGLSFNIIEQ